MINAVIGIISYLPDDAKLRKRRITDFNNLLEQLNDFMPMLPILVIAQN